MPYVKISELPAATVPLMGTELVEIVQLNASKQVAASELGPITRIENIEEELTTAREGLASLDDRLDNIDVILSGAGTGSVTSVGVSVPSDLDVTNSPITNSGTISITRKVQAKNLFLAGPTTGVDAAPTYRIIDSSDIPAQPFDVTAFYPGTPLASAILLRVPIARAVSFLADFSGSYGKSSVAAAASTVFDIQKNGVSVGSMTFALGATTATFSTSGAVTFEAGDILSIIGPATPDATLANIGLVLAGLR